jgi:hypothetical protein
MEGQSEKQPTESFKWQHVLLLAAIGNLIFYKQIDALFPANASIIKHIIRSIPLALIIYYHTAYNSFSLVNLGVDSKNDVYVNNILLIFGSYGLIQMFAPDSSIHTDIMKHENISTHLVFIMIAISIAFASGQSDCSHSFIGLLLYYHIRYVINNNVTYMIR